MTLTKFRRSHSEGKETEARFSDLLQNVGFQCEFLEDTQSQCIDHVDFRVTTPKENFLVEVKGLKRMARSDESFASDRVWLEFRNVCGNLGWIYGKADYLAFETPDGFLFIKRNALVKWAEENINFGKVVFSPNMAYKKAYTRKGRQDLISYVTMDDIRHLVRFTISEDGIK